VNGILTITNVATGLVATAEGVITHLIQIKNALSKTGENFDMDIKTLDGDIVPTTGDTVKDADAWLAAHPESK
jgi:hypothetical protein